MTRSDALRRCGWAAVAAMLGAALIAPSAALATKPAPEHKVTICHATDSNSNPYVKPTVDIASSGHLRGGHDTRHKGPIWSPTLGKHVKWGDIIPPYTYGSFNYPGQNWTEEGRAIHAAGCMILTPTTPPTTPPTEPPTTPPTEPPTGQPRSTPSGSVLAETGTPAVTPSASVLGETGTPGATPPSTDVGTTSTPSGGGFRWVLVGLAGLLAMVLLAARPVTRRR